MRLTGQSETALQEIARRRLTQPRALVRQLRGDLEWITGRALEKEPARRYPSASELRADVQRHLSNEVVQAGPPSIAHRVHSKDGITLDGGGQRCDCHRRSSAAHGPGESPEISRSEGSR